MDNTIVEWLLESANPSIRYLTLRNLLDRPQDDPDVQVARQTIMQTGPVPMILADQTEQGTWQGERGYYTPKYVSSHWSMVLLVEYAADPADPRIQRGAEAMLGATDQRVFKSHEAVEQDWGCFWGNILRYVVYTGYADDPRLPNIVKTLLLASQSRGWGCRMNDELACAWGAIRALWGLAALPNRTPEIEAAIQSGIEFVFGDAFALRQGDYPTPGSVHKHWSRLNFPLYYQADILFALRVAADLKLWDRPRVQDAVQWLSEQRQSNGRWRGISPYRTQSYRHLGNSSDINRWVSYHAAYVLKQAGYMSD